MSLSMTFCTFRLCYDIEVHRLWDRAPPFIVGLAVIYNSLRCLIVLIIVIVDIRCLLFWLHNNPHCLDLNGKPLKIPPRYL